MAELDQFTDGPGGVRPRVANNSNSTRRLHVLPEETPEHFGVHSKKVFADQGNVSLSVDEKTTWDDSATFANGRVNHAHKPETKAVKPSTPTQNYWQGKAEAIQGDRAHETDQLRRIFITGSGLKMSSLSSQVDWKQTFEAREAAYKQMVRAKERSR